ncbi:MAG: hypothetical protein ABFD12_01640 [Syntrophorhabdus sp.]
MTKKNILIALLAVSFLAGGWGCTSIYPYIGYEPSEPVKVTLNEGVRDALFLNSAELEIIQDIGKERAKVPQAAPLKISRGLSFAAKERAVKLSETERAQRRPQTAAAMMERINRFGKVQGSAAELVSYGYSARVAVHEMIRNNAMEEEPSVLYFMDPKYTVMGIGCKGDFYPICVMIFSTDFSEP